MTDHLDQHPAAIEARRKGNPNRVPDDRHHAMFSTTGRLELADGSVVRIASQHIDLSSNESIQVGVDGTEYVIDRTNVPPTWQRRPPSPEAA